MDEIEKNNGEIIIYRTEDGRTQLEVRWRMRTFGCHNNK